MFDFYFFNSSLFQANQWRALILLAISRCVDFAESGNFGCLAIPAFLCACEVKCRKTYSFSNVTSCFARITTDYHFPSSIISHATWLTKVIATVTVGTIKLRTLTDFIHAKFIKKFSLVATRDFIGTI